MDTFDGACHTFRHARVNVLLDLGQLVFQVVSSLLIVPTSINLVKEKQNIVQSYEILITSLFTSRVYYNQISISYETNGNKGKCAFILIK